MDMAKVFNHGAEARPKCSTCCSSGDDREVSPPLLAGPLAGRQGEVDTLESWFQRAAQDAVSSFLSVEKPGWARRR
jgi:hypothetical protein